MRYPDSMPRPIQYIDASGTLIRELPTSIDAERLIRFYQTLVLIRTFDQKAVALQRTGQIGTYASSVGQEAIGVGIGEALEATDIFVPYYRDIATQYLRGVALDEILLYWGGDERGNYFTGDAAGDFPLCGPLATQVTHAAGVAAAMKIRDQHRATLVTCGDGATSRGDFYESLNLAGVWQLPLVVVVNNNQWAISVPRTLQSAASTLADKSHAAGIEGIQVDGNDVCAVFDVVSYALRKARSGKGATLIEALSYRLGDHTTADDATRYRAVEDVNAAWRREPIRRLREYLHQQQNWNESAEKKHAESCIASVQEAVDRYTSKPAQAATDTLDYLFAELPASLYRQRQQVQEKFARLAQGGGHGKS
jgi:pyruvate dehydrogenase E1 component alpha subunit